MVAVEGKPIVELLLNTIISNPHSSLKDLAALTGYSRGWISTIINSDGFKAQLMERQLEVRLMVHSEIVSHVKGAAIIGLERLQELLPSETNLDKVKDTTAMLLDSLQMGPTKSPAPAIINNNNVLASNVPLEVFQRARQTFGQSPPEPVTTLPAPHVPVAAEPSSPENILLPPKIDKSLELEDILSPSSFDDVLPAT